MFSLLSWFWNIEGIVDNYNSCLVSYYGRKKSTGFLDSLNLLVFSRAFNIFQVYQYFTIYKLYFLLKCERFSWMSYTTLFEIRRYQLPF
jgi:hypothetical protein